MSKYQNVKTLRQKQTAPLRDHISGFYIVAKGLDIPDEFRSMTSLTEKFKDNLIQTFNFNVNVCECNWVSKLVGTLYLFFNLFVR